MLEEYENEVPSTYLGELVMDELRDVDQVSYVRFASVYREFTDIQEFLDELEGMLDRRRAARKRSAGKTKKRAAKKRASGKPGTRRGPRTKGADRPVDGEDA